MELTNTEQRIIDLLKKHDKPLNTVEVAELIGTSYSYANQCLWLMTIKGVIKKTERKKSKRGRVYYHLNEDNKIELINQ